MSVRQFNVGGDRNFAYVCFEEETKEAFIVDPSYSPEMVVNFVKDNDLKLKYVFNTHDHHDHSNGNSKVEELTGAKALQFLSIDPESKIKIEHGSELPFSNGTIKILHTPGHTPDSICILFKDALFTGDTLFVGKVGGTDFGENARLEYESLHNIIAKLPLDTIIYCGHDVGIEPVSTIGQELEKNPFYLQKSFEDFLDLKKNWLEYKRIHGID